MSFKDIFGGIIEYVGDNLPTICAAFATTTSVGALGLGIMSQKKVDEKVTEDMSKAEKAGVYLEEQAGTVIVEALSVGAICLGRHASQVKIDKLEAEVASAINLACIAWDRLRLTEEKTKELVGEEKAEEIKKAVISEEHSGKCCIPISDRDPNIYRFEDPYFNCYFYMTYRDFVTGLYAAEAHINRKSFITVAEIYYFLGKKAPAGSEEVTIDLATIADEWGEYKLPITAEKCETEEGGIPFLVICYNTKLGSLKTKRRAFSELLLDDK